MSLDPRRSYTTVVHSRTASQDSRSSTSSRSSTEVHYSASTMAGGHESEVRERVERRRVPDNERHFVTITSTQGDTVLVTNHGQATYNPKEPRASDATSEDYKRSQQRTEDAEHRRREDRRRREARR